MPEPNPNAKDPPPYSGDPKNMKEPPSYSVSPNKIPEESPRGQGQRTKVQHTKFMNENDETQYISHILVPLQPKSHDGKAL